MNRGVVTGTVGILGPPGGGDQGGDLSHLPAYLGLKTGTKEQARSTSHTKHDKQKHKSQDIDNMGPADISINQYISVVTRSFCDSFG